MTFFEARRRCAYLWLKYRLKYRPHRFKNGKWGVTTGLVTLHS